jgi:hypothetical protein
MLALREYYPAGFLMGWRVRLTANAGRGEATRVDSRFLGVPLQRVPFQGRKP